MMILKALHPRDDIYILYLPRKKGERGLASIRDGIDTSLQRLENYIKKLGGRLITVTRNNTGNARCQLHKITRKQKMERKTTVWTFQETNK